MSVMQDRGNWSMRDPGWASRAFEAMRLLTEMDAESGAAKVLELLELFEAHVLDESLFSSLVQDSGDAVRVKALIFRMHEKLGNLARRFGIPVADPKLPDRMVAMALNISVALDRMQRLSESLSSALSEAEAVVRAIREGVGTVLGDGKAEA